MKHNPGVPDNPTSEVTPLFRISLVKATHPTDQSGLDGVQEAHRSSVRRNCRHTPESCPGHNPLEQGKSALQGGLASEKVADLPEFSLSPGHQRLKKLATAHPLSQLEPMTSRCSDPCRQTPCTASLWTPWTSREQYSWHFSKLTFNP